MVFGCVDQGRWEGALGTVHPCALLALVQFLEGILYTDTTVSVGMSLLCVCIRLQLQPHLRTSCFQMQMDSRGLLQQSPFILWLTILFFAKFEKYSRKFIHRPSNRSCAFSNTFESSLFLFFLTTTILS